MGLFPGFLGYQGYPKTLCTSVNSQVVHGIPSEKVILEEGDMVSVDCGVILNGFYGDTAFSFQVGEVKEEVRRLITITRECLLKGVEQAIEGKQDRRCWICRSATCRKQWIQRSEGDGWSWIGAKFT